MNNQLFCKLFANSSYGLEDFMTEVLAGVLRSDQSLLDDFVNVVLKIEGNSFIAETQKVYGDSKIDLVFSNKDTLCFLESKVDSFLETAQLEKLKNVLSGSSESLHVYLRYCTKYYVNKSIKGINFDQFRWEDVYTFLQTYSKNPLIKEYLGFLEDRNMNRVEELNADDLLAIGKLAKTIHKMDLCLDSVAAEFVELFDSPNIGVPKQTHERLQDLIKFQHYHMTRAPLLQGGGGEWGWSDVRVCFTYSEEATHLMVWYWCGKTHPQYELLKKVFKEKQHIFSNDPDFIIQDEPNWFVIAFKKPLTDFSSQSRPLQAIHSWFIEHMRILRQFSDKTPELNWNIRR